MQGMGGAGEFTSGSVLPKSADGLIPDILTSDQYARMFERSEVETFPEKRLAFAVLSDAVNVATRGYFVKELEKDSAAASVWVETECWGVYGFDWVCEQLGLAPEYMRPNLLKFIDTYRSERLEGVEGVVPPRQAPGRRSR